MILLFSLLMSFGLVSAQDAGITYDIKNIPDAYFQDAAQSGRIERVEYTTTDGYAYQKYTLVYVPYGYDESEANYNVFYVIHGGGGSQQEYFSESNTSVFHRQLDHMILNGDIEPMIVVAPTYYAPNSFDTGVAASGVAVASFARELKADIIPAVESRYRTFAVTTDGAGITASRDHRAIGGFSMGSVTTWYAFLDALDVFRWFMPISGDCWVLGTQAGLSNSAGTAKALADAVPHWGYTAEDFYIYALTGTNDIAYSMETAQIEAMKAFPETFQFGTNTFYGLLTGGYHNYPEVRQYIYNALPKFFK